jgi:guanylate kinase
MSSKTLIIIGPTAVGKSTLVERALRDYPQLEDIITFTTRTMRPGEREGQPYHFVSEERFRSLINEGHFVEWAVVHGRLYGTPKDQILAASQRGKIALMDIDVQGAKKMMREFKNVVTIFLLPPTIDSLRERFRKRGITDEADLEKRLANAQIEMAQAGDFDHVIVNRDLDVAYAEIRKIIDTLVKNQ